MSDSHKPSNLDDALKELAAAAAEWRAGLVTLGATLREMQATMPPVEFETWAVMTAGLDRATLADLLAFDGDLAQVTDRLLAAMGRVVSALS